MAQERQQSRVAPGERVGFSAARGGHQERQSEQQAHPSPSDSAFVEQGGPSAFAQGANTSREVLHPGKGMAASSALTGTDPGPQSREDASSTIAPHGTIFASGEGQPSTITTGIQYNCSICLDSSRWKTMKSLPCRHEFHKVCIDKWLNRNGRCPLCRTRPTPPRNVQVPARNQPVTLRNMTVPVRNQLANVRTMLVLARNRRVSPQRRRNRNVAGLTVSLSLRTLALVSLVAAFLWALTTIFVPRAS
ncbi:hypothetical protein AVEN_226409-1 [Araneus ventricosus]|uniref:RING-type E3 ubiquitin transferase n=1 Tax=Araneus ventricosus TaxID=182803 RepID=A0A4Y2H2C8_ARAVE|nr:hypothetical protein AVEN_226409-1 [Araneus ventricosus]